jgi:hypothetical protein
MTYLLLGRISSGSRPFHPSGSGGETPARRPGGAESDTAGRRILLLFCSGEWAASAMDDIDVIKKKLEELKVEHRDLDEIIKHLSETRPFDQLQIQRLKKRKLLLKDQISRLQSMLLPDIIA